MTDPDDILELSDEKKEEIVDEFRQEYLVIGGEEEDELIETPFYSLPPSSALIPQATEKRVIEALDNLFAAIVGLEARAITGQIKFMDVLMGNDSVTVRLQKNQRTPLAVSITTMGFYQ